MSDKDVNLEVMSGFTTDKRMIVDNTNYVYKELRDTIREDVKDYKLLCSVESNLKDLISVDICENFKIHLENRIDKNILKIIGKPLI